jgi:hypothetical protein
MRRLSPTRAKNWPIGRGAGAVITPIINNTLPAISFSGFLIIFKCITLGTLGVG